MKKVVGQKMQTTVNTPPTGNKISWKPLRVPIIVLIVLALIIIVGGIILQQNSRAVSVGMTGYAANITLSGMGAPTAAQASVDSSQGKAYIMTTEPTGTELCTGNIQGITYVVRDTGSMMLIGNY